MDYDTSLITLVKQFPELYDNSHGDFKNKDVRQAIWGNITYQLRKECDENSGKRKYDCHWGVSCIYLLYDIPFCIDWSSFSWKFY